MHTPSDLRAARSSFLAKPLLFVTPFLLLAHVLAVTVLPHRVLGSNLCQLAFPLVVVLVALEQRTASTNLLERRYWTSLAVAFGIWSSAQALYIYFLFHPAHLWGPLRWDDALWLLFGFPLLLSLGYTHGKVDLVGKLDRAQAGLFCVVLYFLAFVHAGQISVQLAYLIQNVALMLCCLLRLPQSRLRRERRFFVRLFFFLLAYGSGETIGEAMYKHGWPVGSLVDLNWTAPIALFLVLILRDNLLPAEQEATPRRWSQAVDNAQGAGIAALTLLALGASIFLATQRPLTGSLFVCFAFGLFALRTALRESAWHRAHNELKETVLRDTLTGCGNRTLLRRQLEMQQQTAAPEHVALIYIDLDRFKHINDSLGHALGDELLIQLANRLRSAAPANSTVCRLGGDEFVVLTTATDVEEARITAEVLLRALRPAYQLGTHNPVCTASIGVVLGETGEGSKELLRSADHAMYRAKQLGKDCVQVFDEDLRSHLNDRWQMEADLRTSVEENGVQVAFQPILNVERGEITGFEALARWTHPRHGSVSPARFIAVAEDSGLILPLGNQVLRKACAQIASWNLAWGTQFSVSVNMSPRQFTDATMVPRLLQVLESTGLDPRLLRLEMTESALLVNEHRVKETLDQIRSHGIRIALDDFGTGYSSLAFLLNLPVDEVKVDRSFVFEMHLHPQRREMVRTVVQLGHTLGKRVVAEGVETDQELQELAAMGCECAQGYLIGRPMLAEQVEATLPGFTNRPVARLAPHSAPGALELAEVH